MIIRGNVHKYGDNINTDLISPACYMELSREEIAKHAMEGVDPNFHAKVKPGDILVAGKNFGAGSSRETAPAALKDCGISLIIAQYFARIFYRNSMNIGVPVLILEQADQIREQDELIVDLGAGKIHNVTQNTDYVVEPIPPRMRKMLKKGGLIPDLESRMRDRA